MMQYSQMISYRPQYFSRSSSATFSTNQGVGKITIPVKYGMLNRPNNSAILSAKPNRLSQIYKLFQTRNRFGWDGYDAIPITEQSRETAGKIIDDLPLEIINPEIVPTSSGGYSFEWKDEHKYLVIEIENCEVSCVLIHAKKKNKKTSFTENYQGNIHESDFVKWIKDEFPLNEQP